MTLPKVAISTRAPSTRRFAELFPLVGPEQIGATGDNSYRALFGRPYALALGDSPRRLRLYRGAVGGGSYELVEAGLPEPIFGPTLHATARRFSAAFDQSARIIVAYEDEAIVRVTRWTGSEYVQNVTFAGVDPALLIDASLADPRGYPTAAADGWSVRDAYEAGTPVLFEWLAGDPPAFLESALPDSDVLLFYLTPDRLELRVRVQRQLYATPITVATFAEPVILDRVIALAGRYQALVSDAAGDPLPEMLISDPYLGDFVIAPDPSDTLSATLAPEALRAEEETYLEDDDDTLDATLAPESVRVEGDTALRADDDTLDATLAPEDVRVDGTTVLATDDDALDATLVPEDPVLVETTTAITEDADALDATLAPETIRVQTV